MALNIRNAEAESLAAELARQLGETKTDAVIHSLRERLTRVKAERSQPSLVERLEAIADRFAKLPVLDDRSPDEILGYDENGLPS